MGLTYEDAGKDAAAEATVERNFATPSGELRKLGFRRLGLMRMRQGAEGPAHDSEILVNADGTIAVALSKFSTLSIYVTTLLADGTLVETQERPSWSAIAQRGPALFLHDHREKIVKAYADMKVEALLATHDKNLRTNAPKKGAPVVPFRELEQYLALRRRMGRLILGKIGVNQLIQGAALAAIALVLAVRAGGHARPEGRPAESVVERFSAHAADMGHPHWPILAKVLALLAVLVAGRWALAWLSELLCRTVVPVGVRNRVAGWVESRFFR
jgi:hypothetical protein